MRRRGFVEHAPLLAPHRDTDALVTASLRGPDNQDAAAPASLERRQTNTSRCSDAR